MWSTKPPTYDEWMGAKNHGVWWVKFRLCERHTEEVDGESITWPEAWYTEIVSITCSYPEGFSMDKSKARLHASGRIREFDLDDSEATRNLYWQPVKPPDDDVRDQQPTQLKDS